MTRWAPLSLGLALYFSLSLSLGSLAAAQDAADETPDAATDEARGHFEEGSRAFDVGEYARAASEFRAAYELHPHPDLLFNIYSSLERQGDLSGAADALEGYLRDGDPDDERRGALTARLGRLRTRLAQEQATEAERRASEAEQRAAEEADARRRAEEAARDRSTPSAPQGGGVHPAGIGVLIGGGVLLASFGVFAALTAVEDANLSSTCDTSCSEAQVSTLSTFALVADISWIAGAVAAATGVVLVLALPADAEGASAALTPFVTAGGGGGTLAGRF